MNFLKKLFSKSGVQDTTESQSKFQKLTEADNLGTRCETQDRGETYFITLTQKDPEPIIFYFFDNKDNATKALSNVSCIAVADDSGKLICTDILTFGVFPAVDTDDSLTWGALLAGKNLTYDVWVETQKSFKNFGGRMRREDKPIKSSPTKQKKDSDSRSVKCSDKQRDKVRKNNKVKFSHNINLADNGGIGTKNIYKAPSKDVALKYLKSKNITEPYYYVEIETPDGWFGKDKDGTYDF